LDIVDRVDAWSLPLLLAAAVVVAVVVVIAVVIVVIVVVISDTTIGDDENFCRRLLDRKSPFPCDILDCGKSFDVLSQIILKSSCHLRPPPFFFSI
jgi:hypothetical protein